MIQSLRRAHWRTMLVLAWCLPVLLLVALLQRKPTLYDAAPPTELTAQSLDWAPVGSWIDLQGEARGRVRAVTAGTMRGLDIDLSGDLDRPDVLAYWSPEATTGASPITSLPDDAWFLGTVRGPDAALLKLPDASDASGGVVALFSLGHGEIVGWAEVETP